MRSSSDAAIAAYRRLFLNEAGGLKPHARLVLEDLLKSADFFALRGSDQVNDLLLTEGARRTVRYIIGMSGAGTQMMNNLLKGEKQDER